MLDVVRDILTWRVKYDFVGTCPKCDEESEGPTSLGDAFERFKGNLPSHYVRLKAVEAANKIAWGEKIELAQRIARDTEAAFHLGLRLRIDPERAR